MHVPHPWQQVHVRNCKLTMTGQHHLQRFASHRRGQFHASVAQSTTLMYSPTVTMDQRL